jgi:hypothetical protein
VGWWGRQQEQNPYKILYTSGKQPKRMGKEEKVEPIVAF